MLRWRLKAVPLCEYRDLASLTKEEVYIGSAITDRLMRSLARLAQHARLLRNDSSPLPSEPGHRTMASSSTILPDNSLGPVYFWREFEEPYAFLSQWFDSPFEVDGVMYASTEMWMMVQKARLFGDEVRYVQPVV